MGYENNFAQPRPQSERAALVEKLTQYRQELAALKAQLEAGDEAAVGQVLDNPDLLRAAALARAALQGEIIDVRDKMHAVEEQLEEVVPEVQSAHVPAESQRVLGQAERENQAYHVWDDPRATGGDPERRGNNNPTF